MTTPPSTTSCPTCGTVQAAGARFCSSCGTSLAPATPDSATVAMPADDLLRMLQAETTGSFEIVRELGRGGMGAVYLAVETSLGRSVAIKVLPPEFAFSPDAAERFRREARTAAALDHPGIIPIHRVSQGGRLLWFAMKYLEGRSLDRLIAERGRLSLAESMPILAQVADALDFAHKRSVVHRDFKPHNVVLDARGQAVVTDFGLAKARQASKLTATGSVLGTPHYMAPEQWMGGDLTGATDQYALAVMVCQMLSGRLPFDGDSLGALMNGHVNTPPPVDDLLADQPAAVRSAVSRALSKQAPARFPTVGAFVEALRTVPAPASTLAETLRVEGPPPPPPPRPPPPPPLTPSEPARRSRSLVIAAPIIALMLLAGGFGLWRVRDARGSRGGPVASGPVGFVARAGNWVLSVDTLAHHLAQATQESLTIESAGRLATQWVEAHLLMAALAEGRNLEDDSAMAWQTQRFNVANLHLARLAGLDLVNGALSVGPTQPAQIEAAFYGQRVRYLHHILIAVPADASEAVRTAAFGRITRIQNRLRGGASFETLARMFSEDSGSAVRGGRLGLAPRGRFIEPFESRGFALEPGGISDVVESLYGLHLIWRPPLDVVRDSFAAELPAALANQRFSVVSDSVKLARPFRALDEAVARARVIHTAAGLARRDRALADCGDGDLTETEFAALDPGTVVMLADSTTLSMIEARCILHNVLVDASRRGVALDQGWSGEVWRAYHSALENLGVRRWSDPDHPQPPRGFLRLGGEANAPVFVHVEPGLVFFGGVPSDLGNALRESGVWQIYESGLEEALALARALRGAGTP